MPINNITSVGCENWIRAISSDNLGGEMAKHFYIFKLKLLLASRLATIIRSR